ncbi:MAG: hypothetical protein FJ225_07865 [Lentisphaerae bacterium]|nr:hypothetical protein [Lentisphaerota bacterium]
MPGDIGRLRLKALLDVSPVFSPAVFDTEAFPPCRLEDPGFVEDLIGPYSIRVTWYDKNYERVQYAKTVGRYGAVVEIVPEDGRAVRRFRTVYRVPPGFQWGSHAKAVRFPLPEELGIQAEVAADCAQAVGAHDAGSLPPK